MFLPQRREDAEDDLRATVFIFFALNDLVIIFYRQGAKALSFLNHKITPIFQITVQALSLRLRASAVNRITLNNHLAIV